MARFDHIVDAHICPRAGDRMKPWHSFICSQCMGKGTDIAVPAEEITAYNKKNEEALLNKNTG